MAISLQIKKSACNGSVIEELALKSCVVILSCICIHSFSFLSFFRSFDILFKRPLYFSNGR